MENIIIETIKSVIADFQQQISSDWVNLANLGTPLSTKGVNFKNYGFLKLREMFEDPELQMFFELKKDNSHNPPIYYVKLRDKPSLKTKSNISRLKNNDISIMQWAYFPQGFPEVIQNLKDMALNEKWYYKRQNPAFPNPILSNYFKYTFVRLFKEKKIEQRNNFAAFNTGLVNNLYDSIYALFQKNKVPDKQEWFFLGFCVAGSEREGKTLSQFFNPLPEKAKYFQSAGEYIYDGQPIQVDWDHIILEHIERLPIEFIERYKPKEFILEDPYKKTQEQKIDYFKKMSDAIKADDYTFRIIKTQIATALDTAIKRANWNYKTAIPMYYPARNTTSLLLPIALQDERTIDVALVIEKTLSGNYIGQTILTLEMAYTDARLITRPDSDWLVAEQISETDDNMED